MLEIEEMKNEKVYGPNTIAIGLARVGSDNQKIVAGTMEELSNSEDLGEPLHSLIIPGKMHFLEAEMVKRFCINSETFDKFADVSQH